MRPTKDYKPGSHKAKIIKYLMEGYRLSQSDASLWWGCARLAARIEELRRDGWKIVTNWKRVGKTRFASYRLEVAPA